MNQASQYPAILSTAYFPPVQFFSKLVRYKNVYIEKYENFNKQSFRNRCEILAANGKMTLSVPVEKGRDRKVLLKNLRISYQKNWQKNHWKSIESAYRSSPFFEFYCDEIQPFFQKKYTYLLDLNHDILLYFIELLEIDCKITFTNEFYTGNSLLDFRYVLHPKEQFAQADPEFIPQKYRQVFAEKFPFIPNLSILDTLFNLGPHTWEYLNSCIKTDE